jgi:dienelactone hydrolase
VLTRVPLRSEIYQVTGPVERFAGQIASQGYIVGEPTSIFPGAAPKFTMSISMPV